MKRNVFTSVPFVRKLLAFLFVAVLILPGFVNAETNESVSESDQITTIEASGTIGVRYRTHIQNIGWQTDWAYDGTMAGTEGQGLRLEGIEIELTGDVPANATIEYRTHVQNVGWEDFWSFNGSPAGSEGQGLRLEGIQIQLVDLPGYSIEYRTHVQNKGWESTWAKDGEISGSQGEGLRLEGIEIRLVQNGPTVVTDLTEKSNISTSGGTVNLSDGAKVSVPSGAFTDNSTLDFSRMVEAGGSESFYALDGLPAYWMTPMAITLPLNNAVVNGEDTYLAVYYDNSYHPSSEEMGLNRQLIKATVADGMATIQLPTLNPDLVTILSEGGSVQTEGTWENYKIYIAVAANLASEAAGWSTEYFGRFKLTVPTAVKNANPALITEIKNALTESSAFIEDTAGVNMSYAGGRNPFPVEIFDFSSLIERYFGGRSDTAWGYIEVPGYGKYSQSAALSSAWISINSNKFSNADAAKQIRATIAHELFHYYEQLYLPNDRNSQSLLQDASSAWLEFQMMKKYPGFWPAVIDSENAGWFPIKGLLRMSNTRCHNEEAHAYATSLFLQYMTDQQGSQAIGKLWQSVKTNDELFKAIADGFNGDPNWYTKWPDFVKKFYSGDYTKAMPDSDWVLPDKTWTLHNSADLTKRFAIDDPYTDLKHQFTADAYVLSAQSFPLNLRYGKKGFNAGDTADLKITNQNSADVIVYLFKQKSDGGAELVSTLDSSTPYVLKDMAKIGKQTYSLVFATKWQPTAMGFNETKNIVIDTEIVFDNQAPDDYDCGWIPDYTNLIKKTYGASDLYKYGFSYYDSNGRRHGLSRSYFDAAQTKPHYATPFYEGKVHGIQTIWYENGNMEYRYEFQHGQLDGITKTWYENGQIAEESNYSSGLLNGAYKSWFNTGITKMEGTYKDNKKEGTWSLWYGDGTKLSVYNYSNGMWNGLCTDWYDNGVKASEGYYVNDQKTGEWSYWDRDGKPL